MPILEERSQLTNWHTVDTSDKYTNLRGEIRGGLEVPDPVNTTKGVNYFLDIHATGFTVKRRYPDTDFKLNDSGGPAIPQTLYLDSKGDFNPLYTKFNKAEPVFRVGSPDPGSPMENKPLFNSDGTPINSLFNRASTPNRKGFSFIPEFEYTNRYPTIRPTTTELSRIYFKHAEDRDFNLGFQYPWMGLEGYHDQLSKDQGILGIRNDKVNQPLGFEQPFVIREIGERWGIDRVQRPDNLGDFIQIGLNYIDQVGDAVFGREPSVFIDRYVADITRLTKAAAPEISPFKLKYEQLFKNRQKSVLISKFDKVTTARYQLIDIAAISNVQGLLSAGKEALLDPGSYNEFHIHSVPGVLGIPIIGIGLPDFQRQLQELGVGIATGIAANIMDSIGNKFDEEWGEAKPILLELGNNIKGSIINAARPFIGQLKESNFYKKVAGSPAVTRAGSIIDTTKTYIPQGINLRNTLSVLDKVATKLGQYISPQLANQLNIDLSSVKEDKVNLIPYGSNEFKGQTTEELDFIPFKFFDANNGAFIVFRAALSGITDTFSPEYTSERYIGRPDSVYVYQGTNREISFTFDVYPGSPTELKVLWEKLNYLAGLTYPSWASAVGGGMGMIAPFTKLTIGDMYNAAPGYISALTYTVQDNGTWETTVANAPKYIQVSCTFVYVGDRLPSSDQKHFDLPWVSEKVYQGDTTDLTAGLLSAGAGALALGVDNLYGVPDTFASIPGTRVIGQGILSEGEKVDIWGDNSYG